MGNLKVVGIGGWVVSNSPEDILRTYALGSCIALILHHMKTKTMGLVHIALPDSLCHAGSKRGAGYYASSAVPLLLNEVRSAAGLYPSAGAGVAAILVGGAAVIVVKNPFHIGERILKETQQMLRRYQIPVVKQDTGGAVSRTVSVYVASGEIVIKSPGRPEASLQRGC